jgi:hypothetical protein
VWAGRRRRGTTNTPANLQPQPQLQPGPARPGPGPTVPTRLQLLHDGREVGERLAAARRRAHARVAPRQQRRQRTALHARRLREVQRPQVLRERRAQAEPLPVRGRRVGVAGVAENIGALRLGHGRARVRHLAGAVREDGRAAGRGAAAAAAALLPGRRLAAAAAAAATAAAPPDCLPVRLVLRIPELHHAAAAAAPSSPAASTLVVAAAAGRGAELPLHLVVPRHRQCHEVRQVARLVSIARPLCGDPRWQARQGSECGR